MLWGKNSHAALFLSCTLCTSITYSLGFSRKNSPPSPPPQAKPQHYYYNPEHGNFMAYGDWIYWKPIMERPLNFAYTDHQSVKTDDEDTLALSYDYHSGFRVGIGYRFGTDTTGPQIQPWAIAAEYTQLSVNTSKNINILDPNPDDDFANLAVALLPLPNIGSGVPNEILTASSSAPLKYKRADFTIGWPIMLGSNIILKLSTGAVGAQIKNNWVSNYVFGEELDTPTASGKAALKWKWEGGGLLGKGDILLPVGVGFGFFASTGFGLLMGTMKQSEESVGTRLAAQTTSTVVTNKNRFTTFQPMWQFGAGLDWRVRFTNNPSGPTRLFYVAAGWECFWWFNMDQFGQVNARGSSILPYVGPYVPEPGTYFTTTEPADLIFQGITARAGINF